MTSKWLEDSDFVARFRGLYDRNVSTTEVTAPSNPPQDVVRRLDGFGLEWAPLHPFVKQAVLWDMGLVHPTNGAFDNENTLQQVYTKCDAGTATGLSMASIAVTKNEFESTSASETLRWCRSATTEYARQEISSGLNLRKVSKCATMFLSTMKGGDASMWSQDASALNAIPDPQLFRHSYDSWKMIAIHNRPRTVKEALWGTCPDATSPGYLTIPCVELNTSITDTSYCKPAPSALMDKWLQELKRSNTAVSVATEKPTTLSPNRAKSMHASTAVVGVVSAVAAITSW
ncbi:hypothetical protein DYB32_001349 [Aphanomyces invadans]|uniref:Uncharacterized protein n=1 Tax=Aphanomyces invadans TaxID=157072 RepID=A0A418B8A7_9STRA|nr:hypothetical protein DYB32_001349 [Aphanomyces invadans]